MARTLCDLAPAAAPRIVHIPWGIPDQLLRQPPERPARPAGGPLRVLYAGRLTAEKGAVELLAEIGGLAGVEVAVAAPQAEFAALRAAAPDSAARVHTYLGWLDRPALWRAFAAHDLLVVPSVRLEAFGLVAVEAQACGLPVLYRRVPGLSEVLGDSAASYAADPAGRPLAEAVARLREDAAALEEFRALGLANAARYPLSQTAKSLTALSEDVQRMRL
jgi:glycosyltransferase involved in cell wall biosynthesis